MTAAIATAAIFFAGVARAQTYNTNNVSVSTFVGYGIPGYVDGRGLLTAFNNPAFIVSDTASNLYVWDSGNARIRKITPDGAVSTFAGGGSYLEGFGTNVSLSLGQVSAMAMDNRNQIWLVIGSELMTIGTNGYAEIVNGGLTNLNSSSGMCFDSGNNLYYSGGNQIYRYDSGTETVETFAGSGISGYFDGQGTLFSAFSGPTTLACDQADNIYVWDSGNGRIRRIDQQQNVTTVAGNGNGYYYYSSDSDGIGTNAGFNSIYSMFFDHAGNLYMICGSCIRMMDAQLNVTTLAGSFSQGGYNDGAGDLALFNSAGGGCLSQGMVFVADRNNNRIRNIAFNAQAQPVAAANLQLNTYPGLQICGSIGRTFQIQSSPDLINWNTEATVLISSSPYLWIDRNPIAGNKYYRAVTLP